jgi:hypothetical protein
MTAGIAVLVLLAGPALAPAVPAAGAGPRTFATPEEAVRALAETVKAGDLEALMTLFGPAGRELVDTSDPATGKRNREVFAAAFVQGHRLEDKGADRKELVLGDESWPFPVPIVRGAGRWSFDAAAGREEILNRRIGRNELAVIQILHEFVAAQRAYATTGHDGKRAGLYARRFGSDRDTQNGLYWPTQRGEPRSPLGVTVARAAGEGYRRTAAGQGPIPLYGYYFRILEGQGKSARGGAAEYVKDGEMSGGFGLVAWPVHYDASGIMTFVVNQEGVAYQKDLGPETETKVKSVTRYDPDPTWSPAEDAAGGKP